MTKLGLQRDITEDELRLAASGELDLDSGEVLAEAISGAVTSGNYAHVVVDLDRVTFLDSTGIAVLIAGKNLAADYGVTYRVANPQDVVRRTLHVTGVLADVISPPIP